MKTIKFSPETVAHTDRLDNKTAADLDIIISGGALSNNMIAVIICVILILYFHAEVCTFISNLLDNIFGAKHTS